MNVPKKRLYNGVAAILVWFRLFILCRVVRGSCMIPGAGMLAISAGGVAFLGPAQFSQINTAQTR